MGGTALLCSLFYHAAFRENGIVLPHDR
jgi:hypothetical protein